MNEIGGRRDARSVPVFGDLALYRFNTARWSVTGHPVKGLLKQAGKILKAVLDLAIGSHTVRSLCTCIRMICGRYNSSVALFYWSLQHFPEGTDSLALYCIVSVQIYIFSSSAGLRFAST